MSASIQTVPGTNLITSAAVEETTRGALTMLEFDVGNRTTVYAKVGDYAYNISTAQITAR